MCLCGIYSCKCESFIRLDGTSELSQDWWWAWAKCHQFCVAWTQIGWWFDFLAYCFGYDICFCSLVNLHGEWTPVDADADVHIYISFLPLGIFTVNFAKHNSWENGVILVVSVLLWCYKWFCWHSSVSIPTLVCSGLVSGNDCKLCCVLCICWHGVFSLCSINIRRTCGCNMV